jgi:hypothetical protein
LEHEIGQFEGDAKKASVDGFSALTEDSTG